MSDGSRGARLSQFRTRQSEPSRTSPTSRTLSLSAIRPLTFAVAVVPEIVTSSTSRSKSSASAIALSISCSQVEPDSAISSRSCLEKTSSQISPASPVLPAVPSFSTASATFFSSPSNPLEDDGFAVHPDASATSTTGMARDRRGMLRPEGSDPARIAAVMRDREHDTAPRGRHAPPLEVRQDRQRRRLYAAAGAVFASVGYADATAEAIAREAGMSKATFYEHFDNKEDCIVALHDDATAAVLEAMRRTGEEYSGGDAAGRVRAVIRTFLEVLAAFPDEAQTLLVEIIGAGPRAIERRDRVLAEYAAYVDAVNREDAERGSAPRIASPHDAFAIVGAVVELASRQIRTQEPDDIRDLEPVVERLVLGLLRAASPTPA